MVVIEGAVPIRVGEIGYERRGEEWSSWWRPASRRNGWRMGLPFPTPALPGLTQMAALVDLGDGGRIHGRSTRLAAAVVLEVVRSVWESSEVKKERRGRVRGGETG